MGKDILIRDQIFSTYDSLYDAEKKVADYVAGHQEDVINMSVAELAQNCATSQATVIRFCKKIGCEGFHKLKLKLAGEQSKQEELAASNEINIENMEQSLHNIMVSKVEEIKATFHNFDQNFEILWMQFWVQISLNLLRWAIQYRLRWTEHISLISLGYML